MKEERVFQHESRVLLDMFDLSEATRHPVTYLRILGGVEIEFSDTSLSFS